MSNSTASSPARTCATGFTRTIRSLTELKADIRASKRNRFPVSFLIELHGKTEGDNGVFHLTATEKSLVGFFEAHGAGEFEVVAFPSHRGVEYVLAPSTEA